MCLSLSLDTPLSFHPHTLTQTAGSTVNKMTSQAPNDTGTPTGSESSPQQQHHQPNRYGSSSNFGSGSGGFAPISSYTQPQQYSSSYSGSGGYSNNNNSGGGAGGSGSGPGTLARISSATVENPSPTADSAPEYDRFGHGHYFMKKTFHKPTYCHHCTDMLWGIIGQGLICEGKFPCACISPQFMYSQIRVSQNIQLSSISPQNSLQFRRSRALS